ncbi:MAG: hypothetical protein ABFD50_03865 [Smithella sp.]
MIFSEIILSILFYELINDERKDIPPRITLYVGVAVNNTTTYRYYQEIKIHFFYEYLRRELWVPLKLRDGKITVIVDNPENIIKRDMIENILKQKRSNIFQHQNRISGNLLNIFMILMSMKVKLSAALRKTAIIEGMQTLTQCGISKIIAGETDLMEVLSVCIR